MTIFVNLIHRKCQQKSDRGDINCHMTLDLIFSVVGKYKPYPTEFHLQLGEFVLIATRISWASNLHEY
jgi:hypothetical protein